MIAVIQIVKNATVYANEKLAGSIDVGLYILLGVERGDGESDAVALAEKISKLRIFKDDKDKMNLSVNDIHGDVLIVSNFTLNANYAHGNRPDYLASAVPDTAEKLYICFVNEMKKRVQKCECGVFGADMRTDMSTDGPVTIVMNSSVLLRKDSDK